jgi:transposase
VTTSGTRRSGDVAEVVLGVDTHLDFHVGVVLDPLGRRLGEIKVPTTAKGYGKLLRWAEGFGPIRCAGVEGTGSYGAGLTRHLKEAGIPVMEVERPKRRHLRRHPRGKSDPIDAETAARAVLAGETAGVPKSADGRVEMLRTLRSARRSAVKARVLAANLLKAGHRPRRASPPFTRAPDEGAGRGRCPLPSRRRSEGRGSGDQVRAAFGGSPLRDPLGGDL